MNVEPAAVGYMPQAKSFEWGTPKAFFDELDREFHFTVDVCASDLNAKCSIYFTKEQDGLMQEWPGTVFSNPPYGAREIDRWPKPIWSGNCDSQLPSFCCQIRPTSGGFTVGFTITKPEAFTPGSSVGLSKAESILTRRLDKPRSPT